MEEKISIFKSPRTLQKNLQRTSSPKSYFVCNPFAGKCHETKDILTVPGLPITYFETEEACKPRCGEIPKDLRKLLSSFLPTAESGLIFSKQTALPESAAERRLMDAHRELTRDYVPYFQSEMSDLYELLTSHPEKTSLETMALVDGLKELFTLPVSDVLIQYDPEFIKLRYIIEHELSPARRLRGKNFIQWLITQLLNMPPAKRKLLEVEKFAEYFAPNERKRSIANEMKAWWKSLNPAFGELGIHHGDALGQLGRKRYQNTHQEQESWQSFVADLWKKAVEQDNLSVALILSDLRDPERVSPSTNVFDQNPRFLAKLFRLQPDVLHSSIEDLRTEIPFNKFFFLDQALREEARQRQPNTDSKIDDEEKREYHFQSDFARYQPNRQDLLAEKAAEDLKLVQRVLTLFQYAPKKNPRILATLLHWLKDPILGEMVISELKKTIQNQSYWLSSFPPEYLAQLYQDKILTPGDFKNTVKDIYTCLGFLSFKDALAQRNLTFPANETLGIDPNCKEPLDLGKFSSSSLRRNQQELATQLKDRVVTSESVKFLEPAYQSFVKVPLINKRESF